VRAGKIIGSAIELSEGRSHEKPCYGTYHGDIPDKSFRLNITMVKHDGEFPLHSHEYAELAIVLGGRAMHLTNFGNHPLQDGDVIVINRQTVHGFAEARDLMLCNIMFDPRQFLRGYRDLEKMMGYHALFELSQTPRTEFKERLHLATDELVYITSLVSHLKAEFDGRGDGRETTLRSMFLLLITHLSRLYAQQKEHSAAPLIRMARVISHIQMHYTEPLHIDHLAQLAHWSTSQFRREFKRVYNITPVKFITQVRLHEACELLKDPNRDITSVAMETGFSSSSFFSIQFKKYFGETPSSYRQRQLTKLSSTSPRAGALTRNTSEPLKARRH
jgi:AraC family transcriptional regulator, L-rhamnose operon transcriptional activator RhaR